MERVKYADGVRTLPANAVIFLDKRSNSRLVRGFDSPYQAKVFVNKLKRSKDCIVLVTPF